MSGRKRSHSATLQASRVPYLPNPRTPFAPSNAQLQYRGSQSARSSQHVNKINPSSARGILRRLAKITAPTTKRRIITPISAAQDKENSVVQQADNKDERKVSRFTLDVETRIDEDDSEILVAPTPSALFQYSDDEVDEEPTLTFLKEKSRLELHDNSRRGTRRSSTIQSGPAVPEEEGADEEAGEASTFLTERGRRALSEEPTRMSRYSFGSIRMSDFGSELEVRRESDRQKKLAELEAQDDYEYDEGSTEDNLVRLDGETENLRDLRRRTFGPSEYDEETLPMPVTNNDSFRLEFDNDDDAPVFEAGDRAVADQRAGLMQEPVLAVSVRETQDAVYSDEGLAPDEDVDVSEDMASHSAKTLRRQTLLDSVAAAAKPKSRRKLKLNNKGNLVPSFPSGLMRQIINDLQEKAGKRKIPLGKDHMRALEQATEWFFEQAGEDLEAYANHSKRKKRVDSDDILLLMRRQRVLSAPGELRQMAKDWLPRDILKDLDLPGGTS